MQNANDVRDRPLKLLLELMIGAMICSSILWFPIRGNRGDVIQRIGLLCNLQLNQTFNKRTLLSFLSTFFSNAGAELRLGVPFLGVSRILAGNLSMFEFFHIVHDFAGKKKSRSDKGSQIFFFTGLFFTLLFKNLLCTI